MNEAATPARATALMEMLRDLSRPKGSGRGSWEDVCMAPPGRKAADGSRDDLMTTTSAGVVTTTSMARTIMVILEAEGGWE